MGLMMEEMLMVKIDGQFDAEGLLIRAGEALSYCGRW